jgi:hypothetical protein
MSIVLDHGAMLLVLLGVQIPFLLFFLRFHMRLHDLKSRVLLPVFVIMVAGLLGAMLDRAGPDLGAMFILLVPTMAVLTVLPLIEPGRDWENRDLVVTLVTIALTVGFFVYLWAWNFSGIPTVFLPLWLFVPPGVTGYLQVQVVCMYGEMLLICGLIAGAFELAQSSGNVGSPDTRIVSHNGLVLSIALLFASLVFSFLAVGFLAVFLWCMLQKISRRTMRIILPFVGALGISYLVSLVQLTRTSSLLNVPCDFSLMVMLLLATGVVTLFPIIEPYVPGPKNAALYATATLTVVSLTILLTIPVQDPVRHLASGLSALAGSGLFMAGASLDQGIASKMLLYGYAAVISSVIFAVIALAGALFWKREGRLPATPDS